MKLIHVTLPLAFAFLFACSDTSSLDNLGIKKEMIIFSSKRNSTGYNIFMMNPDGSSVVQLTDYQEGDFFPSDVTSDGEKLLFYRWDDSTLTDGIFILNLNDRTKLPKPIDYGRDGGFTIDGTKIYYTKHVRQNDDSYDTLWLYDLIDNTNYQIPYDCVHCYSMSLSQDAQTICYTTLSLEPFGSQVCLIDIDGSNMRYLTPKLFHYYARNGRITPDGQNVVFVYNESGAYYDICKVNLSTGLITYLTNSRTAFSVDAPNYNNPCPSVDGQKVLFNSKKQDGRQTLNREIWSVNIDGSDMKQLTNNSEDDCHPISKKVRYNFWISK